MFHRSQTDSELFIFTGFPKVECLKMCEENPITVIGEEEIRLAPPEFLIPSHIERIKWKKEENK